MEQSKFTVRIEQPRSAESWTIRKKLELVCSRTTLASAEGHERQRSEKGKFEDRHGGKSRRDTTSENERTWGRRKRRGINEKRNEGISDEVQMQLYEVVRDATFKALPAELAVYHTAQVVVHVTKNFPLFVMRVP